MTSLLMALRNFFSASNALSTVNGPYLDVRPKDVPAPYCIYHERPGPAPKTFYDGTTIDQIDVEFGFYAQDDVRASDLRDAAESFFQRANIPMGSGRVLSCLRVMPRNTRFSGRDGAGNPLFRASCAFRLKIERD